MISPRAAAAACRSGETPPHPKLFHDSIFKAGDTEGLKEGTQQYILELQQFVGRHSRMLKSVVAAQMYASENVQDLSRFEGLHEYFSHAAATAMQRLSDTPKIHPKLLTRISFATILACILFKDWLFPKGLASQAEISTAISDFIMEGLGANAGHAGGSDGKAVAGAAASPAPRRRRKQ